MINAEGKDTADIAQHAVKPKGAHLADVLEAGYFGQPQGQLSQTGQVSSQSQGDQQMISQYAGCETPGGDLPKIEQKDQNREHQFGQQIRENSGDSDLSKVADKIGK